MSDIKYSVTRQTYDDGAAQYASRQEGVWEKPFAQRTIELFSRHLQPPARVLALGCGAGQEIQKLEQAGFDVAGIDLSQNLLEQAQQRTGQPLVCGDARRLPFRPESFDGIWAMASLLHIPHQDQRPVLQQLQGLLRPRGTLLCALKEGRGEEIKESSIGERFFSYHQPRNYARMLEETGFQVQHSHVEPSESNQRENFFVQVARRGRLPTPHKPGR